MRKLEFLERKQLKELFNKPTSAIILASLDTNIGETWVSDGAMNPSGIIFVENTFYIDGSMLEIELIDFLLGEILKKELSICYIIPQKTEMISYFDEYFKQEIYKEFIQKSERHLMDINMNNLNHDHLMNLIKELPDKYQLESIDEEMFYRARGDNYLINFIKLFNNYNDFEKDGFGFFVIHNTEIVAGISSYAKYKNGVEVQIAVKPEYRGQHLAQSLGAKFILECEKRSLYPWWDCANPTSEHIAESLGYRLKQVTTTYKCMLL